MTDYLNGEPWCVVQGDSADLLRELPDASVDAVVTDPPAGIGFMGRSWDGDHGGRDNWVKAFAALYKECLRALKPGGHAIVWALPRTSHWTATALEDAGFEIRDIIHHHFGSGFPKSLDVSKAIDRAAGAERETVGPNPNWRPKKENHQKAIMQPMALGEAEVRSVSATEAAKQWDGWGTALKPATEHWILCRKPLVGTVAENVQAHGTGALNVDGCRVGPATDTRRPTAKGFPHNDDNWQPHLDIGGQNSAGRWPANLVLSHHPDCVRTGTKRVKGERIGYRGDGGMWGSMPADKGAGHDYADPDGKETVAAWQCVEGCPVAELDRQSGELGVSRHGEVRGAMGYHGAPPQERGPAFGDSGGASRFFYCAKPSRAERNAGLDGATSTHPTVKAIELMRWLCRLVTPPGGVVLDPFTGSGSTGCAAIAEGFRFIGFERDEEYVSIARARMVHAERKELEKPLELFEMPRLG